MVLTDGRSAIRYSRDNPGSYWFSSGLGRKMNTVIARQTGWIEWVQDDAGLLD